MLREPYNYTLIARPSTVMAPLRRRLAETPGIEMRWGCEVVGLVRDGGRVAGVEVVSNGMRRRIEAAVVVGGDGAASPVRTALGIRSCIHAYRDGYLTLILPRPPGFGPDGRYYVGRREILGVFPLGADSVYLFYLWPAGDRPRLEAAGLDAFKARLTAIDPAVEPALGALSGWDQVGWMPCVKVVPRAWVADGAVLIGDAAHALNPHVAQGRNQALEDAVALDAVLASCFEVGNFSRRALALYERLRRPRAIVLQRLGDEMAFFWNTGNPLIGWIRNRVFAAMERDEPLRRKMLALVAGLSDRPYRRGPGPRARRDLTPAPRSSSSPRTTNARTSSPWPRRCSRPPRRQSPRRRRRLAGRNGRAGRPAGADLTGSPSCTVPARKVWDRRIVRASPGARAALRARHRNGLRLLPRPGGISRAWWLRAGAARIWSSGPGISRAPASSAGLPTATC
jgi:2-polyprenyl-6-methoxyphenol hydroxylase-like FAD-dependent oxidoreductase